MHLGCRALLGLGLYVSKALGADPADLDKPDDTVYVEKERGGGHYVRGTNLSAEVTNPELTVD